MKKILLVITILFTVITFAQVPQGISYQAIALNSSGNPVASSNVGVRLSVVDNAATGTVLYTETHIKTTNSQGLFNLVIGQGTPVTGTFAGINWGTNSKFLKAEIDVAGGANYVLVGSTQLLSVPYAMYAANVASVAGNSNINDEIVDNKNANFGFLDDHDFKAYIYSSVTNSWSSQTFNEFANPSLTESNGNFAFVDDHDFKVYVFDGKTGTWTSQTFNEFSNPSIEASNGNFTFNDDHNFKIYTFSGKTGTWSSQSYNEFANPNPFVSNNNMAFIDDHDFKVYAYNVKTGIWTGQSFNAFANPNITGTNGNFTFVDDHDFKVYVYNGKTGVWTSHTFNEFANPNVTISGTN